jgi:FKBP-type peptidyl-prolyl cis-trans isomerase FkpA
MMRFFRLIAAMLPLTFTACLSTTDPTYVRIEDATFAPSLGVDLSLSTRSPSGLWYRDITTGTGAILAVGDTARVYYTGSLVSGAQFDVRQPPTFAPWPFQIGDGSLIPGFDEGVRGMRVGGQRQLIIPPELAYGSRGFGPIPGNAILVIVVDAVSAP